MRTTEEIAHLLDLAAAAGETARRVETDLQKDPEHVLRATKATLLTALRAINERLGPAPSRIPHGMVEGGG